MMDLTTWRAIEMGIRIGETLSGDVPLSSIASNELRLAREAVDRVKPGDELDALAAAAAAPDQPTMLFIYRNYRGEVSLREVRVPIVTYFGSTDWHPERQWLVKAFDVAKGEWRDFALKDMRFIHQLFGDEA